MLVLSERTLPVHFIYYILGVCAYD